RPATASCREATARAKRSFGARMLAVITVCGAAATVNAEIVHFVNPAPGEPGHYDWRFLLLHDVHYLDITRAPWEQTDTPNGNSVVQRRIADDFSDLITDDGTVGGHQAWPWVGEPPLANVLATPTLFTA